jgi:hypothetical protein
MVCAPKILFFANQTLVPAVDCLDRPMAGYYPSTTIGSGTKARQVGNGLILSVVASKDREDSALSSDRRSLIVMVDAECDCLLSAPLASLYAKGEGGDSWPKFGGLIEDVFRLGSYYKLTVNPNQKISEVRA